MAATFCNFSDLWPRFAFQRIWQPCADPFLDHRQHREDTTWLVFSRVPFVRALSTNAKSTKNRSNMLKVEFHLGTTLWMSLRHSESAFCPVSPVVAAFVKSSIPPMPTRYFLKIVQSSLFSLGGILSWSAPKFHLLGWWFRSSRHHRYFPGHPGVRFILVTVPWRQT